MSATSPAKTIVLIHGLWMTPLSWEHWIEHYEAVGHRVLAPAWPGFDRDSEDVRRDTTPYEGLGITEIADVVPPQTSRTNFKLYHNSKAVTEYKEFPGRSHYIVGQDGWEEVADCALTWATSHTTTPAPV